MLPILLTGLDEQINTLIPTILPLLPSAVYDALARFKTSQQFIPITLHEAWQVESLLKAPQSWQNLPQILLCVLASSYHCPELRKV